MQRNFCEWCETPVDQEVEGTLCSGCSKDFERQLARDQDLERRRLRALDQTVDATRGK